MTPESEAILMHTHGTTDPARIFEPTPTPVVLTYEGETFRRDDATYFSLADDAGGPVQIAVTGLRYWDEPDEDGRHPTCEWNRAALIRSTPMAAWRATTTNERDTYRDAIYAALMDARGDFE